MLLKCLGFRRSNNTSSSKKHSPSVIEELCHQFSLADLRNATNNFDEKLIIGRGGFGRVYKGSLQHNGDPDYTIALKRMARRSSQGIREFKNEIKLLCQLRHPNLVSLIGFCNQGGERIIVYEYMSNRSLRDHLRGRDIEPLSWKKRLEICIGAARGLHYLQAGVKRTILHRDIKPSHILLDNNLVPKLSDFGVSLQGALFTSKPKPIEAQICGTYGYMAPETAMLGILSDRSDVFSFGAVLLKVISAKDMPTIFNIIDRSEPCIPTEEIIDPILKGKIAPECWKVFMDITERCLKVEPDKRPIMSEVELELEHALELQEEADASKTSGDYSLLSTTVFTWRDTCIEDNRIKHAHIDELCHEFSLHDLEKTTYDFHANRIIGTGSFGTTYEGSLRLNGATEYSIAIKQMNWSSITGDGWIEWSFRKEIEYLCPLRHPNLVSLIGFCDQEDKNILVYRYVPNGSLYDHLLNRNMEPLSWKKRLEICIGAALGLHYLHTRDTCTIFHRNIKLSNILLDDNMVPKLSNFGFPWYPKSIADTEGYVAPEWFSSNNFTYKSDVYSFGVVLLQVVLANNKENIFKEFMASKMTAVEPVRKFVQRYPAEEILDPILTGKIAPECWAVFLDITGRCLEFDPNERPTMNEVKLQLEHALALQEEADANTSGDYSLVILHCY